MAKHQEETRSLFGWYQHLEEFKYAYAEPRKHRSQYLQTKISARYKRGNPTSSRWGKFVRSSLWKTWEYTLTIDWQVNAVYLNIGHITQYTTRDACNILAHALITSQLDYGNPLLYGGLLKTLMTLSQRVQNSAARPVPYNTSLFFRSYKGHIW